MTLASSTSTSSSAKFRLRCDNEDLDGLVVTVVAEHAEYVLVATPVGSGEYRALRSELVPLMQLNGHAGGTCTNCDGMLVRDGKCEICVTCGEGHGHCA